MIEMDHQLTGPIAIGDRLIWEPTSPYAYERIIIVDVRANSDGETWIQATGQRGTFWNEESRVREACIRDDRSYTTIVC